jgi:hypothetical protein
VAEKDFGNILNRLFKVYQRIITVYRKADLDKCDNAETQTPSVQMGMVSFDEPVFFQTFLTSPAGLSLKLSLPASVTLDILPSFCSKSNIARSV